MDIKVKMPSVVVSIEVEAGATVTRGQTLAVVEAMKMKTNLPAPADGTVKSVAAAAGDRLKAGGVILSLE